MRDELTLSYFIPADRHASLSACIGYNGAPLRPHGANKPACRSTTSDLTNIVEWALISYSLEAVLTNLNYQVSISIYSCIRGNRNLVVYKAIS